MMITIERSAMTNTIKDVAYNGHTYIVWDYDGKHVFNDYTAAKTHIDEICDAVHGQAK